jgi:hypothetical protein
VLRRELSVLSLRRAIVKQESRPLSSSDRWHRIVNLRGVFQHGNEISGSYTLSGCKGMATDHGTFDMVK